MTRLAYPPFAFDSLVQAIELIRSGEVVARRDVFANLVWNVQGSLQALVFGNPDRLIAQSPVESSALPFDLEEQLEAFDAALQNSQSAFATVAASNAAAPGAVDPATILAIVNVVLQLLDAWRKRRQA